MLELTRCRLTLMLTCLALAGCGEVAGPNGLEVSIEGPATHQGRVIQFPSGPEYLCDSIVLIATARSGDSTSSALWLDGRMESRYTQGAPYNPPGSLSATDVAAMWGGSTLRVGAPQTASLAINMLRPFVFTLTLRYEAGRVTKNVVYTLDCK